MESISNPLTSREVRWFLKGSRQDHEGLVSQFHEFSPYERHPSAGEPAWRGRLGDVPDAYLLVPGSLDMGIKWREGLLQIKGRTAVPGNARFGIHAGSVECWAKWSYAGLPPAWKDLFHGASLRRDIRRVAVSKQRLVRLFRLTASGNLLELDADSQVNRGMAAEITEAAIDGREFLTLGFEAFPNDPVTARYFLPVVTEFLEAMSTPVLNLSRSMSYPAWLSTFFASEEQ